MNLLDAIDTPADLRRLPRAQLAPLAQELRAFLLESVARTGGHLASNLGSVELTIALHYVFDTPQDRIVWDVGHQCYGHKVLTGRRRQMHTLRQAGGLSGFPRRAESPFDAFGTAHSSTSISAALGMAEAARLLGHERHAVAVCGDGAMSAGMAWEAMNNAATRHGLRLLVVLNDNGMSISPSVGALQRHCGALRSGTAAGASLFAQLGFDYHGPVDGHDLEALLPALAAMKARRGPQLLHVVTRKGQGYARAEQDPVLYHGTGRFVPARGLQPPASAHAKPGMAYTEVFGDWLCDMAASDPRLVGITPAMREGSGLVRFQQRFPERYFDVGIAEQHAVTFAAITAPQPSSSFHMAMRILPARQRAAMFDIYAFCRAVDDIVDGQAPPPAKRAALARWHADVDACYLGIAPPPLRTLARHIAGFGLACADFHAVIDGMLMDAQDRPLCAPPAATLDLYCDRVACAVGRLSVRVFGLPQEDGVLLAHHLGRALQLTNILRDIDEDAAVKRGYLPREHLAAAGIDDATCAAGAAAIAAHPGLPAACAAVAAQALRHYDAALLVLQRHRGPAGRAPRLMGATYRALLERLAARGWQQPRVPVRLGTFTRLGILLRHTMG